MPKVAVMARVRQETHDRLAERAAVSGRSLSAEIDFRLARDLEAEDNLAKARDFLHEASEARAAARILALRDAGFKIAQTGTGKAVLVDPEALHAAADGIRRSGFLDPAEDARDGRWRPPFTPEDLEAGVYRAVSRAIRDTILSKPEEAPAVS